MSDRPNDKFLTLKKSMTIDTFNARIDQSMKDSKNGNLIEQSKLKAKISAK